MSDMASNSPFPQFKTMGDDKHDVEVYIEDLMEYRIMQNCFDPSKETEAVRWTKPEKVTGCLQASLSPAARAVYKYSLGLLEQDHTKPHMVINPLKGSRGKGRNFFPCYKTKRNPSPLRRQEFATKLPSVSMKISLMNWWEISSPLDWHLNLYA